MPPASESHVSLPISLYNRLALCYYGGGPRHPKSPDADPAPAPDELPVGRNPQIQRTSRTEERVEQDTTRPPMIPGLIPVTDFARRMAGIAPASLTDVDQPIEGIDSPAPNEV